jgi:hypothetical protein
MADVAATVTTAQAAQAIATAAPVSAEAARAPYVDQLRAELEDDGSAPAAPAPAKDGAAAEGVPIDRADVARALKDGDFAALAKMLGEDPKAFRVGKSQWAAWKHQTKQGQSKLAAERAELEAQRAQFHGEVSQARSAHAKLIEAAKHLESGDIVAFMESAIGQKWEDIQRTVLQNAMDPSAKEVRRLRAEHDALVQKQQDDSAAQARAAAERAQVQAQQEYMVSLRSELLADESLGLKDFEASPNMARFVRAVFDEQQRNFDGISTITAQKAAKRAIENLLAEAAGWEVLVAKHRNGAKKSDQSDRGARAPTSRSVSRAQGGTTPDLSKMPYHERIALAKATASRELMGELNR